MNLDEYYAEYGGSITLASERLFIDEFLWPVLRSKIENIIPQYKFIDRTGRLRFIDFAYIGPRSRIALEIDGESYHAEGIIPDADFDDNLFRQNEIIRQGYRLARFSYSQLQSPQWREMVMDTLLTLFSTEAPELLSEYAINPNPIQMEALDALGFYREQRGWPKGVVIMPTGTGKTILSCIDARRFPGPILYLVHRLDILSQSIEAYKKVWPDMRVGILTGEVKENEHDCDVLFASKDTLRRPNELSRFPQDWFRYVVIDEVHHGQCPTYQEILSYFRPSFMLGMTATPDRTDRRDIFELFDYKKVYEISLLEVIERGFLVPFTYYGLTDNIDYSRIRYENQRYRVDDLERFLIIPERNEAILREYLDKGNGDKAIGFCVSIEHANRMSEYFNNRGVVAAAIHSACPNRDELIEEFREDRIHVAFTVDLFNEGVDFPNVRILLFLRPTESKTVFLQQLGRGLRLCTGKDRVVILDFIGNYKRANQIRKYLSKRSEVQEEENGVRRRKIIYEYSPGCEVIFDTEVEEILDRQDVEELGITKQDLIDAYYQLGEEIGHKPGRSEIDEQGQYKSARYVTIFGTWVGFLREIGEYTEASYHYPQGTHLGHILSLLNVFGSGEREGSHLDNEYIRLRGELGEGRLGTYRRQVKYKLQAAMELGIIVDDRNYQSGEDYPLELTPNGEQLYDKLRPVLDQFDLTFQMGEENIPSTRMRDNEGSYNRAIRDLILRDPEASRIAYQVLLGMHAVQQMMAFLFHICRTRIIARSEIYEQFFESPSVARYCEEVGIERATLDASRRRCPFLLNILDACDVIDARVNEIEVKKLVLSPYLVSPHAYEEKELSQARLRKLVSGWPGLSDDLDDEDITILRELFGVEFLTEDYYLRDLIVLEE